MFIVANFNFLQTVMLIVSDVRIPVEKITQKTREDQGSLLSVKK